MTASAKRMARHSYSIYVIELKEAARRRVEASTPAALRGLIDPDLPCLYVGYTREQPEMRLEKHRAGGRTSARVVHDHDDGLRPDLYEHLNPIATEDDVLAAEAQLAQELREQGYAVYGSHGKRLQI